MADWTRGKQKRVCILLGLIIFLTASFLTFDWTQYYFDLVRISEPELIYTRIAKTLTSFLIFLLALSVGDDGINDIDPRKLRWSFVAIFAGDLLFLMDEIHPAFDYAAILSFLVGQVLLVLRNGQGFRTYVRRKRGIGDWIGDILLGAAILIVTGLLFALTLFENLQGSPLLYVIAGYALFLDLSLWTAWTALRAGYFPQTNALLIAVGATFFFIGDYLVGFNLSLEPSLQRATTVFLTWVFYAPAITLLALSGYRWGKKRKTGKARRT
jgi:hypothetical protein